MDDLQFPELWYTQYQSSHILVSVISIYVGLFQSVTNIIKPLPNPQKENSSEIFRNQGKCLVISGKSDCALYFCYHECAEIFTEAIKKTVLWYFIFGPFYFCFLDSQEF